MNASLILRVWVWFRDGWRNQTSLLTPLLVIYLISGTSGALRRLVLWVAFVLAWSILGQLSLFLKERFPHLKFVTNALSNGPIELAVVLFLPCYVVYGLIAAPLTRYFFIGSIISGIIWAYWIRSRSAVSES